MVLFRREFSFLDALYLWEVTRPHGRHFCCGQHLHLLFLSFELMMIIRMWFQMMWAMEYNPNNFSSYEKPENGTKQDPRLLKQYGKFERKYIQSGQNEQHHNTLAVFVVASVLETKNKRLLKEAKGLDDVVQVSLSL